MLAKHWLLCTALFSLGLVSSASAQQGVRWHPDFEAAKALAAQTNRLVLLHFWTEGCGPCMQMEREVFSREDVAAAIAAGYVPVRLHSSHPAARQFNVSRYPTDLIITPQGEVIDRSVGGQVAGQYMARLTQVAANSRSRTIKAFAEIPGGPRFPTQDPMARPDRSSFESNPNSRYAEAPLAGPIGDPRMRQPAADDRSLAEAPLGGGAPNGFGRNPQSPVPNAGPQFSEPQGYAAPPWQQGAVGRPELAQAAPRDPRAQPPQQAQSPQQPQQVQPPKNPPLALDGFCSVQLVEKNRWVRGDRRFGAYHRGRTYLFSGSEEQKRFLADPDRFAPAMSGNDVVLAVDQGATVPGSRDIGARFDGRIYLFSSEASFQRFDQDPARYSAAAQGGSSSTAQRPLPPSQPPFGGPSADGSGFRY